MARGDNYQYDTNPRKLQPEYEPKRRQAAKKVVKKNSQNVKKSRTKQKAKLVMYILIGFAVLLTISYRYSLITESFNAKEGLKKQLAEIEKENQQIQIGIENSLNIQNVEQAAKDRLGMQKLNNNQKIYINLPKKDYIESASEQVKLEENKSWLEKLLSKIQ